jgi:hypothetical protein
MLRSSLCKFDDGRRTLVGTGERGRCGLWKAELLLVAISPNTSEIVYSGIRHSGASLNGRCLGQRDDS